jgi:hypothetical protein
MSRFAISPCAPIAFALLLLACQSPPTTPVPPAGGDVCANLAYVFLLVAEERDRGSTKEAQIETVRESVDSPFVTRPEETLRYLLRVVDLVYERSDASASEIEADVRDSCIVDEQRRAVVSTHWPTE